MKPILFFLCGLFAVLNVAQASCQWSYINELNKDIKYAGELLSDYSTCRNDCKGLEGGLNKSVAKMNQATACEGHIYTAANRDMIRFIASRFRLIQKQKAGSTWTAVATGQATTEQTTPTPTAQAGNPAIVMDRPAFVAPQKAVVAKQTPPLAPAAQPAAVIKQTTMTLSPEAYAALWPERTAARAPRNVQRAVIRPPRGNNQASEAVRKRRLAQQRLAQQRQRKSALIQQEKIRLIRIKKRSMHNQLSQQRALRQRLLKRRALMHQQNRQRVRQMKLARAQRIRQR